MWKMVLDRDKCLYCLDKAKMRYNREDEYLAIIQNSLDPAYATFFAAGGISSQTVTI
jgi:hypothetical protein